MRFGWKAWVTLVQLWSCVLAPWIKSVTGALAARFLNMLDRTLMMLVLRCREAR